MLEMSDRKASTIKQRKGGAFAYGGGLGLAGGRNSGDQPSVVAQLGDKGTRGGMSSLLLSCGGGEGIGETHCGAI